MEQLMTRADGLVKEVGNIFPPSVWAAQAMAYTPKAEGWLNLLYMLLAGAVSLGALYLLGEKVFLQGVLAGLKGPGRRQEEEGRQGTGSQGAFWTLVSTERKLFVGSQFCPKRPGGICIGAGDGVAARLRQEFGRQSL